MFKTDIEDMKKKKLVLDKTLPKLIERKGVELKELAKLTGISLSTLYEWKNGRPPKNIQHLKLVSEILCVPLHYLLYGENDPHQQGSSNQLVEGVYEIVVKKTGDL